MIPFLSCAKSLLFWVIKHFVHSDFREHFQRMKPLDRLLFLIIHGLDRSGMEWHRFPVFFGLAYLLARRHLHYHYTLLNVGKNQAGERFNPAEFPYRTANGKFNDPSNEDAGSIESFFGRNIAPLDCRKGLLKPNPMKVATKLLARKRFIDTGKQLNLIAVSWIQFMTHDWMDHLESTQQIELKASEKVANQCPLRSFKFYKTERVNTGLDNIKEGQWRIQGCFGGSREPPRFGKK
ncbi:putative heme peroxidase superfamily, heme peroxidase, animal-type [Helianthus annuus]|nr:putative heme peroxidase superfamily, heme peroxidase, animal-type [Helianthus annuus]KAJ0909019.1 putative heme peroxidase superfamily, heme peroxidase, animal-type [Helianthus annuus]